MADVPHFALPFRFANGHAAEVEQDTLDDVAACVEAVLRTRPGQRDDLPSFGVPEPTFGQAPLDGDELASAVADCEPRARLLADEAPDQYDETVRRVRLTLTQE